MKIYFLHSLIFLFFFLGLHSQSVDKVDSLKKELNKNLHDTVRAKALGLLVYYSNNEKEWLPYNYELQKLAQDHLSKNPGRREKRIYLSAMAEVYGNFGYLYNVRDQTDSAIYYYEKEYELDTLLKDKLRQSQTLVAFAEIYGELGDHSKSLAYYNRALAIQTEVNSQKDIAKTYNDMGLMFKKQEDPVTALLYYNKSLQIRLKLNDKMAIGESYVNIGALQKDANLKLNYFRKALSIFEVHKNPVVQSVIYNNIGSLYGNLSPGSDSAIYYYRKSLAIRKEFMERKGIAGSCINISSYFIDKNMLDSALFYAKEAYKISLEIRYPDLIAASLLKLKLASAAAKDYKNAFFYSEAHMRVLDSTNNIIKGKEFYRQRLKFDYEQKEIRQRMENELKEKEFKAEATRQRIIIFSSLLMLVVVAFFSWFMYSRYKLTQKQKQIIEEQKKEVDIKNREITDSINYAGTIQDAVLPPKQLKQQLFPESFVLFKPRDVVSGDFYWFAEKNGKKIIAAADCTGHGVPGSLMSIIGNTFLNEIIDQKGVTDPAEILSQLRLKIIHALKQSESTRSRDGMDIAILVFEDDFRKVAFAGANNPLWLIRNNEWLEFEANKQPVGYYTESLKPFTQRFIELQKGDSLYIFSDGYADQFGGPKGKKFKYSNFKSLLSSIQSKSMAEQEKDLLQAFTSWKGGLEQTDDVCVIGIKI